MSRSGYNVEKRDPTSELGTVLDTLEAGCEEFEIASYRAADYFFQMSFEALTREVAAWPDEQVRRFQAFLVTLRHQREQGTLEKLGAKLDDPDPSRWVALDDLANTCH